MGFNILSHIGTRMNILELCLSYGFGGLELYALKTVNKLRQAGCNIRVVVRKNTFFDEKLKELDVPREYLRARLTHFPLISAWRLARYINANKIDVIHIHWGYDLALAVLAKVICRRNVRLVYTRQMALTRRKYDPYHKSLYKNVDAYVVITKSLYDAASRYLPLRDECLYLLYYGVPAPIDSSDSCEKYLADVRIDPGAFKLAIFGRVERGKGQYLLVKAVRQLRKEGKSIQLAMIGHIMDKNHFSDIEKEINNSGLKEHIKYLGFHNKPVSIMPCFDVVILASKCETFGLVLPEAMRAGVAVVGSNCGGVPEIIKHEKTGLLFESENVEDLTKQLRKLIDKPEYCQKLAKAGKTDADERFSEEKHFQRLLEIFRDA